MRTKYSVMSPLAPPRRLKNIFMHRPEERQADVSQNTIGHYLSSLLAWAAARRILRQRRLVSFDNTLAGGGHTAPPTSLAPSNSPKPHLAISFICATPVSGSDWALCLTRKVLASLCLNLVPLKFMETLLIPPLCLSVCSSSEWGNSWVVTQRERLNELHRDFILPHAKVWELFISTNAASTGDNRVDLKANLNQVLFETSAYASRQYTSSTCSASPTGVAALRHPPLLTCQHYSEHKTFLG